MSRHYLIKKLSVLFLLLIGVIEASSQLTPEEAHSRMTRGFNMGRSLELDNDGIPDRIKEYFFDDLKDAGFTHVRIPIQWNYHTMSSSPYTVDVDWLDRVEEVVDWGLERGFIVMINSHHDRWILENNNYTSSDLARFDSIWSQVSVRLKDKPDELLFEIANEPNIAIEKVDRINESVIPIIRKTNPTRIVVFGSSGTQFSTLKQAKIPADDYLIASIHTYEPWNFAGQGNGTWGTQGEIDQIKTLMSEIATWSAEHNNMPVFMGEFGTVVQCEPVSRKKWFNTHIEEAIRNDITFSVWHDFGNFSIYYPDRSSNNRWDDVKDVIIYSHPDAANNLSIEVEDANARVSWSNRSTTFNWSRLQRKASNGEFETVLEFADATSSYLDEGVTIGATYTYRIVSEMSDGTEIRSLDLEKLLTAANENPNTDDFIIASKLEDEPTIDGLLSDAVWEAAEWQTLDYATREGIVPSDQSSKFKVLWSTEALYVAVEVFDDVMVPTPFEVPAGTPNTFLWQGDFAQVLIGLENRHNTGTQPDQIALFFQTISPSAWDANNVAISNTLPEGVSYVLIDNEDGSWGHEIRIPWASLNGFGTGTSTAEDFTDGKKISFEMVVTDCDEAITGTSTFRDRVANWSSQSVNESHGFTTTNSLYWGDLQLGDISESEAILATPKADLFAIRVVDARLYINQDETKGSISAVRIYSMSGKEVAAHHSSQKEYGSFDLSDIKAGVYVVNVLMPEGFVYKRKILIR